MLNDSQASIEIETIEEYVLNSPYIDEDGIWVPFNAYTPKGTASEYKMLISRELFIEAYNKWIRGKTNE